MSSMSISIPYANINVSTGHVLILAAAMLFRPIEASWVSALGVVVRDEISGNTRPISLIFNRVQLFASAYAASEVFHRARFIFGDPSWALVSSIMAAVASFLTNLILLGSYLRIVDGVRISTFWSFIKPALWGYFMVVPIAYLIYITYTQAGWLSLVLFMLPLAAARYSLVRYMDVKLQFITTIRSLMAALEARDEDTFGHSDRVSRIAVEVGKSLGFSEDRIEKLQMAAILHDIGKIGIPDAVLKKRGKYSEDEFREMAKHPIIGQKIIQNSVLMEDIALWVRHHHERYDGRGYPGRLSGNSIPIESRIISVCDAYDAMTSSRPYRDRLEHEIAIAELKKQAGVQFDPKIVDVACEILNDEKRRRNLLEVDANLMDVLVSLAPDQAQAAALAYRIAQEERHIDDVGESQAAVSKDKD